MNGLTAYEIKTVKAIKNLAETDLPAAKKKAVDFIGANKKRRVLRRMACCSVKFLFSHSGQTIIKDGSDL